MTGASQASKLLDGNEATRVRIPAAAPLLAHTHTFAMKCCGNCCYGLESFGPETQGRPAQFWRLSSNNDVLFYPQ